MLTLIRQLDPKETVKIIKIGDKLTDNLRINKDIIHKIECEKKYCTKPEFELLLIINEGLIAQYEKVKSTTSPKSFAKTHIKLNGKRYKNTREWVITYFESLSVTRIKYILKEYKRIKKHDKDEGDLLHLIK